MKFSFLVSAGIIFLASCQNHDAVITKAAADTANYTSIKWIDSVKNIGVVAAGKKAMIKFRFVNTGDKPLFIIFVQPGCGCTVADYPKEAIEPGKEGIIKADYDVHKDATGDFRKNITVTTNTKGLKNHIIFFYGSVKNNSDSTKIKKTTASVAR